jgi:hypothetical protein
LERFSSLGDFFLRLLMSFSTAEKLADYEDEICLLRSQAGSHAHPQITSSSCLYPPAQPPPTSSLPATPTSTSPSQGYSSPASSPQQQQTRLAIIISLLSYACCSAPANPPVSSLTIPQPITDLQDALNHEQVLHKAAESRLSQANSKLG